LCVLNKTKKKKNFSIGKSSTYTKAQLTKLFDGDVLLVGGKEIEIMGPISKEFYQSGKCFLAAATAAPKGTVLDSTPSFQIAPLTSLIHTIQWKSLPARR